MYLFLILFIIFTFANKFILIFKKKMHNKPPSKKKKRGKKPEPEEQEGMPQRQHCPPAKHRGDMNP
jgi:hypothetical protein